MPISWGYKITLLYLVFITFIMVMVWKSFHQNVDLVYNDYYQRERLYNTQMAKSNRTLELGKTPRWAIVGDSLTVALPNIASEISFEFQRPSDKTKDRRFDQKLAIPDSTYTLPRNQFEKGLYRLKADWQSEGQSYYAELVIVIPS